MSDVTLSFGANISDFRAAMAQVQQSVHRSANFVKQDFTGVQTVIQQSAESAKQKWLKVGADLSMSLHGVRRAAETVANLFADPLREFSRFEDAATRLAPLTGGLEKAKALCEALRDEAANGTMSFEQLASVAGRLATVFKSADDVRRWTTAFHDLSAGTGLDVNELVGNFVRSRASGRFEAGLMDMFAQKGVNIFPELVKQTGESETALRKMAAAGTLAFSEVEKAILAVSTGTGQFAGQAAKLSNTFGGSVATMVANWKILQAKMAEPVAETLTPALQKISALMSENAGQYAATGLAAAQLSAPLLGLAAAVKMTSGALNAFGASALAAKAQSAGLAAGIVGAVGALGTAAYVNSLNKMENAADALARANKRLGDSFAAMDAAKTREEFDAAKKTALELLDFLDEKGVELRARAGMSGGGVNTFAARETIQIAEERKAAELDKAAALEKAALAERRLAEAAAEAAEISKKAAQSRQEVEAAEKARADARALNAAMTANPIGLVVAGIVAAIAAVAAAGYAIYKNWEPIKAFYAGLFEKLKSGFLAVVGWVKRGFTAAWEWLKNSAVFKAISWIAEKVFGVGKSLSAAAAPAPGVPASAAKLPISGEELTTMSRAAVSRSSTANTDARAFTTNASITINQQPGEDADALAERVSARLAESYSGALAAAI